MQSFPPTVVLRHKRENLKKCSLRGLEKRSDFQFYSYPSPHFPPLSGYVALALDAPLLTPADETAGLFIIDATWRYAGVMERFADGKAIFVKRSLPGHYRTAYPRRQEDCSDPERGLASIEAIYIAYQILGRNTEVLLDGYYWKDLFLEKNGL